MAASSHRCHELLDGRVTLSVSFVGETGVVNGLLFGAAHSHFIANSISI